MRKLSEAAQVAKLCRKYLKLKGIEARVRSFNYSMGDDVNIVVCDQSPKIMEELKCEFSKYEYGHFDGMTDYYNVDNVREDIPQTKYLFVSNIFSDSLKEEAKVWLANTRNIKNDSEAYDVYRTDLDNLVYRVLTGNISGFWEDRNGEVRSG